MSVIERASAQPLHEQIRRKIRQDIESGIYPPGSALPTEAEMCGIFGVSRYPLRQAMHTLVEEGLVDRTRGKGSYVRDKSAGQTLCGPRPGRKTIALVMTNVSYEYPAAIVDGFVNLAASRDYASLVGVSRQDGDESITIERMVRAGAAGIVLFTGGNKLDGLLESLTARGIYISLIDRNPGLEHIDFISTDNAGGGYLAARHLHQHRFSDAAFCGESLCISAVRERLAGFRRGLAQYQMSFLNPRLCGLAGELDETTLTSLDCSPQTLTHQLVRYRAGLPAGVFCENDYQAGRLAVLLQEQGLVIGRDIGLIGFDNTTAGKYLNPPLTSVAQNGVLIGETAAGLAIDRLESGSRQSVRHILPTQLIIRKSCGEE